MKKSRKLNVWLRYCAVVLLGVCIMSASPAFAEWHFGIGTGMSRLSVKGDLGWETKLNGPLKTELDLKPDDINDLMQSAFGFGGYATDGTWMIQYAYSQMKLGGDDKFLLEDGTPGKVDLDFNITKAEMTVGRNVYKSKHMILGVHGGFRYNRHEIKTELKIGDSKTKNNPDNNWTDVLIGASLAVPITDKWVWNNKANAGFGGSNGTYSGTTGLTWRFLKHWSGTVSTTYSAVDFEEDNKGDKNWYLYDNDEFSYGISFLFNW